jgi:hypothetical protein
VQKYVSNFSQRSVRCTLGQSPLHCGSQVVYARCQRAASVELFAAPVSCGGAERLPLMSALKCLLFIRRGEIRLILKSLRKKIDPQELEGGIIGGHASFSAPRSLRVCSHRGRPDQGLLPSSPSYGIAQVRAGLPLAVKGSFDTAAAPLDCFTARLAGVGAHPFQQEPSSSATVGASFQG